MKRIVLIAIGLLCTAQISFAQGSKVMAAYNYLEEYKLAKNGEDLVEAKEAIDKAVAHETTGIQGKTWYYRGMIYQALSKDELLSQTDPTYLTTAIESFAKALSLEDKKFRNREDAVLYIRAISSDIFNSGADAYQNGDYAQAYKDFNAMKAINETLKNNNGELVVETERCVSNAAASAEAGGLVNEAIAAYEDLLTMTEDANNYVFLSRLYKKSGDKEKAMATLDMAADIFPENAEVVIEQLNYFIEDNNIAGAIDKIDKAIELQPENDMLYFIKGNAYDKSGDMDKAIVEYEKAIEINPSNDKAIYNAGAMFFLGANKFIKEMNDLDYNETTKYNELNAKRREMYLTAKPYFEKVLELIPEDVASKKALFKINSALK